MEVIIRQLVRHHFNPIHICVGHLAALLRTYFGDGEKYNVKITYSTETKPLGTIGPLTIVENMEENVLVLNADTLSDLDYQQLYDYHVQSNCALTIASYSKNVKMELGVLELDDQNRLRNYIEKPELTYQVSMGIYVLRSQVISLMRRNEYCDFPSLVRLLIERGEQVNIYSHTGVWHDLGNIESFEAALKDYKLMTGSQ
jgi:NDP-sugar pyrophosphorylase family protein